MQKVAEIEVSHGSRPMIGIIGGHLKNTTPKALALAESFGERLAKLGLAVVCGGEDGIMEAVCKGAKNYGGTTIAITKSNDKKFCNKYIDYVIPTSLDLAFMNVLVWSSDVIIAFDGKYGTMSEVGLTLDIGKPLIMLGEHKLIQSEQISSKNFFHFKNYSDETIEKTIKLVIRYLDRK